MPAQGDHVEGHVPEDDRVAVGEPVVDVDRECVGVLRTGRRAGSGRPRHLPQGADVVVVLVGRHDHVEPLGALLEQGPEAVWV